jgi:hypothetical protein
MTPEDVWFGNKKHKFRSDPHNISVMHPTNLHTISHLKFVLVNLPLLPAPTQLQLIEQIFDLLMNSIIHKRMLCLTIISAFFEDIENLSKSFPVKFCNFFGLMLSELLFRQQSIQKSCP